MAKPRVLVVEDDASLRRFVNLALEDLDIELIVCESVKEALDALHRGPAKLILTDLMMPGESGASLLKRLRDDPSLRQGARLAVFSAGLDDFRRSELLALDVWRFLHKPVSAVELMNCILEGIGGNDSTLEPSPHPQAESPVHSHFAGDHALYEVFLDSAVEQLPSDIQEGNRASEQGDLGSLERVAHSLKSVMQLLENSEASALAKTLEGEASRREPSASQRWPALREAVEQFVARHRKNP